MSAGEMSVRGIARTTDLDQVWAGAGWRHGGSPRRRHRSDGST